MHLLAVDDVQSCPFKFSASIIFVKKINISESVLWHDVKKNTPQAN